MKNEVKVNIYSNLSMLYMPNIIVLVFFYFILSFTLPMVIESKLRFETLEILAAFLDQATNYYEIT
jgi:hypothetical protein